MDLLLIVLMMFAGAGLGAIVGLETPVASPEAVVLATSIGGVIGTIAGYGFVAVAKSLVNRLRTQTPIAPTTARASRRPLPFRARMARFAGKGEQEVMNEHDTFKSTMPFWSAVGALLRVPPKSAAMIRQSLMSIRRILSR